MKLTIFSLLFLLAFLNIFFLVKEITNPQDTTMPESAFAYNAFELSKGEKIYKNFFEFPFNIAPYTPLYYFFLSFIIKLLNLKLDDIFFIGRSFNFILLLIISSLIYFFLRKEKGQKISSFFTVLLLLSNLNLYPWAVTLRSDLFGILFSLLAFFFYKNLFLSILFALISFYFKQSFIVFPISLFLFYLINKKYKNGIFFFVSFLILIFSSLYLINFQTKGLFFLNIFFANQGPMEIKNFSSVFGLFLQNSFLILSLGFFSILNSKLNNILSIYSLLSLFFSIIFSLKLGSNTNYFLETLFLFSILSARTIEKILSSNSKILFCIFFFPFLFYLNIIVNTLIYRSYNYESSIRTIVINETNLVLTDSPRLAILSKKPFLIDPFNLSYLEKKGKWSSNKIEELFKERRIGVVILMSPIEKPLRWQKQTRMPEGVIKLIKEYTYFYKTIDNYYIYFLKPK